MKERILKVMEREQMPASRFADEIGIQRSALSHILNERNKASLEVLMKILGRFDYLNTDWLLFGKGAMVRSDKAAFQPVLFGEEEKIVDERPVERKYGREEEIKVPFPANNIVEKEVVIIKEAPRRDVSKILIFYSDNTYQTFVAQKEE